MVSEGDWKHFKISIVQNEDLSDITNFLEKEFHFEEPIGKYLPLNPEYVKIVSHKIEEKLKTNQSLSLIARHKATRNVCGVQLVFRWTKEDAKFERQMILNKRSDSSQNSAPSFLQRKVMDAIYAPMKDIQLGIFETFGVSEVAWNFVSSTGKEYCNQGLASELHKRMVIQLKKEDFKIIFGLFSSPYSRRSAEKAGFQQLSKSYYNHAKGENGELVLPQANHSEDFVSLMVLQIN